MNVYLKSMIVLIIAIAAMGTVTIVATHSSNSIRNLGGERGSDYERASVEAELRNYYNEPGEGAVMVVADQRQISLQFRETPMRTLRRSFFTRHRDDFKRFYLAGFDTLTVEAKRDDGTMAKFDYDLTLYR